jgi:hypothetical protein
MNAICAELADGVALAEGIEAGGNVPIFNLCCTLLIVGFDPAIALHVHRGPTLVLRITNIGSAAELTIREDGAPRSVRWAPHPDSAKKAPRDRSGRARIAQSDFGGVRTPAAPRQRISGDRRRQEAA